ncbi:nitrate reductase molybdenum cofactor assembly chaperone [Bacillus sp. BRMEA1]|uniref:nitrate reductase molybdenum cofactor assembly chaperone n=1 Tax=Neobacillus endophyticus TaxID=2738405 RepID=UPI0015677565|nr:nitrate reductase molybdenum cofactor assembly chaperone [Neobacillus endophyticus]NRD79648.1 nitrate reductase molybdenum cofactor assembly chaperone [Neobacillus endophyticus]
MNDSNVQEIFQLCSYLLTYPDKDFIASLSEAEDELEFLTRSSAKDELKWFFKKAMALEPEELVAAYIHTFDFGKKTNLYITYMSNGEQRERGMDLLFLKNYYQLYGFEVTDKELPDYLPIMLEFAGQVEVEIMKPIFERYFANIKEIADHLHPEQNLYGHIMKSIILALKEAGIKKTVRRSDTNV